MHVPCNNLKHRKVFSAKHGSDCSNVAIIKISIDMVTVEPVSAAVSFLHPPFLCAFDPEVNDPTNRGRSE